MAGAKKDPAFLFYATTWLQSVDVCSMTLEQQGAYVRLLCFAWLHGSIPADREELSGLVGLASDPSAFDRIWRGRLARVWVEMPGTPGRLINERQEHERAERAARAEEMRARGQAGGKQSAKQRASTGQADDQADRQPKGKPSTSTSTSVDGWMDGGSRTRNQNGEGVRSRGPEPAGAVAARIAAGGRP